MKDKGIFRSIQKFVGWLFSKKPHSYPDPVFEGSLRKPKKRSPHKRKKDSRPMIKRGNLGPPPCEPGSVSYHDMLVRKFGRREADKYARCLIAKQPELLPTSGELIEVPDWVWRR